MIALVHPMQRNVSMITHRNAMTIHHRSLGMIISAIPTSVVMITRETWTFHQDIQVNIHKICRSTEKIIEIFVN
jgi:hypothetical protein